MGAEAGTHEPGEGRLPLPHAAAHPALPRCAGRGRDRPPRPGPAQRRSHAGRRVLDRAASGVRGRRRKMVAAAERLYGPYAWGRWDVLVLPPSFPFGGMENPRLTFATPDRPRRRPQRSRTWWRTSWRTPGQATSVHQRDLARLLAQRGASPSYIENPPGGGDLRRGRGADGGAPQPPRDQVLLAYAATEASRATVVSSRRSTGAGSRRRTRRRDRLRQGSRLPAHAGDPVQGATFDAFCAATSTRTASRASPRRPSWRS